MSVPMRVEPEVARMFIKHASNLSLDCPLPKKVRRGHWASAVAVESDFVKNLRGQDVVRIRMSKPRFYLVNTYVYQIDDFHTFLEHHPEMKSRQVLWELQDETE